jgi:3-keto-disaccharide hydrolase
MLHRLCLAALLAAGLALGLSARAEDKEAKPINLFNGKNLDGWKIVVNGKGDKDADEKKTWSVNQKDKVLVCKGEPWGYAITEKDYGDYKLELEWRWADTDAKSKVRRNSGVLLHCQDEGKPWPKCFEAQLLSGNAGDIWLMGLKVEGPKDQLDEKRKGHWFRAKTEKEVEKPLGQWNKYEITCKGDTVSIVINGQKVNEAKKAESTKGRIALQSEGAEIHFRNLKLTPLK